jgi:pimeloyl-ACP methyl ester carboxylesterase
MREPSGDGPVILVGHSYGGVVITQAGIDPKVKGLVYISAFAPDAGESALSILKASPVASPAGSEILLDKAGFSRISRKGIDDDFAEELSPVEKAVLFSTQGPTSAPNALSAVVTEAAWKSKPSWTLLTAQDRVIPLEVQQSMAKKIGSQNTTVSASHLALLAHPQEVASVIEQAARGAQQSK